ncbi:protein MNN4 [Durio zibethinus]|uniref:Protein MNN4 n=1 Tax=Durio zibethinus TaxID=66656 RepID=A0A6P5XVZ9_DURZI|nr:protein MNN4 [Durio zibethinus]XP_022732365.1 protein MNN4 [Durio zibethinus]
MKTVTGKILSSTAISVSSAAKIISNFAATDNGASQAVSAYLRRSSASFSELKQLHRELRKPSKSDRKHKKSKSETTVEGAGESSLEPSVVNWTRGAAELSQEASHGYGHRERKKLKNKNKKEKGEVINFGDEGKIVTEDGESKRKKEKNEGNFGKDEGKMLIEQSERKKHKNKEKGGEKIEKLQENGVNIEKGEMRNQEEREGEKNKKKKRKSREIEDGIENNSSSELRKKKKKKIENEVDK